MSTLTTSVGPLSHGLTSTQSHDWHASAASVLGTVRNWYDAALGAAQLAALPPRVFADIVSDAGVRHSDNHVRDEFGRRIY